MAKKQNGFGKAESFAFKDFGRIDKGKAKGAAGLYPSNRRFGSSVQRSVIEKYDLDSDWTKWRKGFEYANKAAWYRIETYNDVSEDYEVSEIRSKLYQGTAYEIDVVFDGYKFATQGSDSNNHYVMKRTVETDVDLGTVTSVQNDSLSYPKNKANREIWVTGTGAAQSRLLLEMIGDRITDGTTEASLNYVLNSEQKPAIYIGKSSEDLTSIKVTVPLNTISGLDTTIQNNYNLLVGDVIYVPEFYIEKSLSLVDQAEFVDDTEFFRVSVEDYIPPTSIEVLDASGTLPPTLYDISTLPKVFTSNSAELTVEGTFVYNKELYQRFWGSQYLTAEVVEEQINTVNYSIMPFKILGVEVINNNLVMTSVPSVTEFKLISEPDSGTTLIFTDYSFTKRTVDSYDNVYYHNDKIGQRKWDRIDTDVDPWMDEVFTSGSALKPAVIYACSCPNHSQAILSAPQETQDEGTRKINRQRRYPLPTVLSAGDYDAIGLNGVAGKAESWESREHRMSFKMCKHTIASMFIERIKIQEPNSYPSIESRLKFEDKLKKDIDAIANKFTASYKRGGITALEVVFALAQGLNLSDTETAYVLFNNNF
tara:strand:+ start:12865 stop:14646 length:1782 start_codon:yes stop_codon:yes gene_type:complete